MKKNIYLFMLIMIAFTIHQPGFCQTESILWSENFEGNWYDNWSVENGSWEVGTPTSGPNAAYAGTQCAATILAGNYGANATARLVRFTTFVVPAASDNPRLRFYQWFSFAAGDYGYCQIKPSGSTTWKNIGEGIWYTSSGVWSSPCIDLREYAGQTVQISFKFTSDNSTSTVSSGWYIDNVSLVTGPVVFNNPETFENGLGDWGVYGGTWEVGDPTGNAHGGQNCAATNLTGNYAYYLESLLISPSFVLPSVTENPRLRFWHLYNFAGGDFGLVLVKPTISPYWVGLSEQIINTSGGIWTYTFYDLSVFAGQEIQVAFLLYTDASSTTVSTGWYIDDVLIEYTPYSDQISLNSGWNLLSFDVATNQAEPATIFQPLISTSNLQMVTGFQNQQGVFFDPDGPSFMNTLKNIKDGEGYWAKLLNAASLSVTGISLSKNFTINLLSGWNLIGHWPHETTTPELAFASLIAAGKLEMVTSFEGGGKFFDPDGPQPLNTLIEIKNGFGYWVKLNANFTDFSYPASAWACGDNLMDTRNGKSYETVKIGTQCWMKQNLNVGTRIAGGTSQTNNGTIEKYCYNNLESYCDTYGGLYQWDEMMNFSTIAGSQGICPTGWHVPSDTEWCTLTTYLDPTVICTTTGWTGTNAGGKLKTTGYNWTYPNTGATNSSGFSALPGGCWDSTWGFDAYTNCFQLAVSSLYNSSNGWRQYLGYNNSGIHRDYVSKSFGLSVRCLKD